MKCIIADDHGMLRAGLRELLKSIDSDLVINEVDNFTSLYENLFQEPDTDLVLLDLIIPGITGLEGLTKIKQTWPAIAVVMVSSSEDPTLIRSAIAGGASGYVPKSTPVELLPSAFQLILAGGVYVPPLALHPSNSEKNYPQTYHAAGQKPSSILTPKQQRILGYIAEGFSNKEIAIQLDLAEQTVKNETSRIFKALGVTNRAMAAATLTAAERD